MKKFDPNRPLWLYKLREHLLLFDCHSEEERMLAYRYGWHIFSINRQHFEDFKSFIRHRERFMYFFLVYPILAVFFVSLVLLSALPVEAILKVPMAIIFAGIAAGMIHNLIGNTLKNIRETTIFLNYVDPTVKMANFLEFENLDFLDEEGAPVFYENMRAKRDCAPTGAFKNKLDKTEKLLTIDFLLGEPGTLNELINKLCLDQNSGLTKEGVYRVLGEVLTASPDNIKKDIAKGVKEIRIGNRLSSRRVDQLRNVKEIFTRSKLTKKADEIDGLFTGREGRIHNTETN